MHTLDGFPFLNYMHAEPYVCFGVLVGINSDQGQPVHIGKLGSHLGHQVEQGAKFKGKNIIFLTQIKSYASVSINTLFKLTRN